MTFERMLTYKGETLSVSEWARRTGLKNKTIYMRLNAGWSVKKTLEKALQNHKTGLSTNDCELKDRMAEIELVRFYLKTQSSDVEESRDEGSIL